MRLVFPVQFDTAEEDACPDGLEMVELWIADRPRSSAALRLLDRVTRDILQDGRLGT
jgi:hypothetical protein